MIPGEEIITLNQIENAWGNSNFGEYLNFHKRELINNTLLKCASGYHAGYTAQCIVRELELVDPKKWELTSKGKAYLYEAFSQGVTQS